jgi:multiple sugar transport system ATP-binding protein
MRAELKKIQQEQGQTTVYVTHDQVEAMSLADRIAVMNFAVLQQYASPHEVYNRPKNLFVANFIGSPTINFMEGVYRAGEFILKDFSRGKISLSKNGKGMLDGKLKSAEAVVGIRPEHLKIETLQTDRARGEGRALSGLKAKVVSYEPLGSKTIVYLHPDANSAVILKSSMDSDYKPAIGEMMRLVFNEKDLYVFEKQSTELAVRF